MLIASDIGSTKQGLRDFVSLYSDVLIDDVKRFRLEVCPAVKDHDALFEKDFVAELIAKLLQGAAETPEHLELARRVSR